MPRSYLSTVVKYNQKMSFEFFWDELTQSHYFFAGRICTLFLLLNYGECYFFWFWFES